MQAFVVVRSIKTCIGVVQKCTLDLLVVLWFEGVWKFNSFRVNFSCLTFPRVLELLYQIFLHFSGFIPFFNSKQGFKKKVIRGSFCLNKVSFPIKCYFLNDE